MLNIATNFKILNPIAKFKHHIWITENFTFDMKREIIRYGSKGTMQTKNWNFKSFIACKMYCNQVIKTL